jgi:mannose-6-phosphate isomerase
LLDRKTVAKVWGGRALEQVPGIRLDTAGPIGETWELYDRPEGSSRIRGTELTLRDLMLQDPLALLGRGVPPGHGGYFPLLLKFIDARESLSVQVHPDDEQAKRERDSGKSEAWVVLAAGPQARVVRGIRPGVAEEEFRRVASTKEVESVLWSFRPEVGDCIHVPAGTVHAIGPDVVVFEVQQNSDITYRLYDWGRPREVHVQQALAVTRFDGEAAGRPVVKAQRLPDGGELVLHEPHFRLRRYHLTQRTVLPTNATYLVCTVVAGRGMLGWHSAGHDEPLHLQPGDTALVPACAAQVFLSPIGKLHLLVSDPGKN